MVVGLTAKQRRELEQLVARATESAQVIRRAHVVLWSADGVVAFADIFAVQPFGNSLVTLTLTGAQIKTLLEQQWLNQPPSTNFLRLQANPGLQRLGDQASYTLYRVDAQ